MSAEDAARAAAKGAVSLQILGLVGLSIDGVFWLVSHGRVLPGYLAALAVLGLLLVLLLLLGRRRAPSVAVSSGAALINVAVVLAALWSAGEILARDGRPWVPFQPQKLGVLALALIAPSPAWVGVLSILAFTLASVAQYLAFPAAVRERLMGGEPWGSFAFGAFALVALAHRLRLARLEREAARAQAEAETGKRLAAIALAVRDLSNTPLQTLRLSVALLDLRHPEEARRLDQMGRAIDRLEELDRAFARCEAQTEWRPSAESFDPLAVLQAAISPAPAGPIEHPSAPGRV
jgi:signal transduction histidine kinase